MPFRLNSRIFLPRNLPLSGPRFAKISSAKISSLKVIKPISLWKSCFFFCSLKIFYRIKLNVWIKTELVSMNLHITSRKCDFSLYWFTLHLFHQIINKYSLAKFFIQITSFNSMFRRCLCCSFNCSKTSMCNCIIVKIVSHVKTIANLNTATWAKMIVFIV